MNNQTRTDVEVLNGLIENIPLFQSSLRDAVAISICDRERWIYHLNHPNLSIDIKAGTLVPKDEPIIQGALLGKSGGGRPPAELYGVPFYGKTTPIYNNGRVIGAIAMSYNIDTLLNIESNMEKLNEITLKIRELIQKVNTQTEKFSETSNRLYEFSKQSSKNSEEIGKIVSLIQAVSERTNILGLNANIEAARAGEAGRGFSIVANEIRNISQDTTKSSKEISLSIENVKGNLNEMIKDITNVQGLTHEQVGLIKDITVTLETLLAIIELVKEYTLNF